MDLLLVGTLIGFMMGYVFNCILEIGKEADMDINKEGVIYRITKLNRG